MLFVKHVNNVLCFISTAKHTYTDHNIICSCQSFYKADEISEAKDLLFEIANEAIIKRRGESRMKNDLCDMLTLMRKLDENKMPPAAGIEVVAEHIVSLMSEITLLRAEVTLLKDENPSNSFIEIKEELKDIKLILNKNPTCDGASASSSTGQGIGNETPFADMLR